MAHDFCALGCNWLVCIAVWQAMASAEVVSKVGVILYATIADLIEQLPRVTDHRNIYPDFCVRRCGFRSRYATHITSFLQYLTDYFCPAIALVIPNSRW
jgi:hypothetical protein